MYILKRVPFLSVLVFFVICVLFSNLEHAPKSAYSATPEVIENFNTDLIIKKSSEVEIVESIKYNFGQNQKHGIIRDIPFIAKNKDGQRYKLEISIVDVSDEYGNPYNYSIQDTGELISLKIGDAQKTISGLHMYKIRYIVNGAITYFSDHDELYWNVTGHDWDVPIKSSTATISFYDVKNPNLKIIDAVCFTGFRLSTDKNCKILNQNNIVTFQTNNAFEKYQGLTIAISFPNGILDVSEAKPLNESPLTYDTDKGPFLSSLLASTWLVVQLFSTLLAIPLVFLLWRKYGKDPIDKRLIVRMYDPPKDSSGKWLTPLEVGVITDEKINPRDISAEIVNLAVKKYIKIVETQEKVLLFPVKKLSFERGAKYAEDSLLSNLKPHEVKIFKALELHKKETVNIDDVADSFSNQSINLHQNFYDDLTSQGYFVKNPQKVIMNYFFMGVTICLVSIPIGICVIAVSFFMPQKTKKGVDAKRHSLGLLQFLTSQDRQFEFQEKNFYLFEKLLPYAIVFGVANIWAKEFEDLHDYKPQWYEGSDELSNLNSVLLVNSLNRNLNTIQNKYVATRTSSSSGFHSAFSGGGHSGGHSGGGFGGGGGRSW